MALNMTFTPDDLFLPWGTPQVSCRLLHLLLVRSLQATELGPPEVKDLGQRDSAECMFLLCPGCRISWFLLSPG